MNTRTTILGGYALVLATALGCGTGAGDPGEELGSGESALSPPIAGEVVRYFDGKDDRVVVPQRTEYDFGTGDFTLAVSAKVTNAASTTVVPLISKRASSSPYAGFYFIVYGNQLLLQIRGLNALSATVANLRDGNHHHLAVRRQAGVLTFFVDGVATGTANHGGNATGPSDLTFGYDGLDNRGLRGGLRNVAIWSAALANSDIAAAAGGAKLIAASSRGYWDLAKVARDLVMDESALANTGYLGLMRNGWDDRDPNVVISMPVVGASIGTTKPAKLAGVEALGDSCGDVLVDGTHDIILNASSTVFASSVQSYMCQNFEKVASSKGSLGITVPIEGIPIGLTGSSEHSTKFRNEYCKADSVAMNYATASTIVNQIASPVIVDAWLECMKLKETAEIVHGSTVVSMDGKVLTLTAWETILVPEQGATVVYDFQIVGATCTNPFQTDDVLTVSPTSVMCTRSGNSAVTAVLNTNHGPVIYNFGPATSADVWVTGNTLEWKPKPAACNTYITSQYNCPAIRFPRPWCSANNGREYPQSWSTAANQRASNARIVISGDASYTQSLGVSPTVGTSTTVMGTLLVYKQSAVTWQLCADIEEQTPTPYTTATAKVDTLNPFVVEVPLNVQTPVLHVNFTDTTQKLVDLTSPGPAAAVYSTSDGIKRYYEVTMN